MSLVAFSSPVRESLAAAKSAQIDWASRPIADRLAIVESFRKLAKRDARGLAEETSQAVGRPVGDTVMAEVLPLLDSARYLVRHAKRVLAPARPSQRLRPRWLVNLKLIVRRVPFGTILIIGPNNYPLTLVGTQALQALVAGNAVLIKPAPGTALPLTRFADLLREAGLPLGLCAVLPDTTEAAQETMGAGVDKVVLTGSAETGRRVLERLAPTLTPATMELSGADIMLALPDAKPGIVAAAAEFGATLNDGRTCIAPRRLLVPKALQRAVETDLAARFGRLPKVTVREPARGKTLDLVRRALDAGGRLAAGGLPSEDGPMTPLLVADAPDLAALFDEDLFAPVLAVSAYESVDEAVRAVNAARYGLGASVFGPTERALAVAERLDVGCVTVNDVIAATADPRLPFGGRGWSGFGTTRGAEGLLAMTRPQAIGLRPPKKHAHLSGIKPRAWFGLNLIRLIH